MFGLQSQAPAFLINMHKIDKKEDAEAMKKSLEAAGAKVELK